MLLEEVRRQTAIVLQDVALKRLGMRQRNKESGGHRSTKDGISNTKGTNFDECARESKFATFRVEGLLRLHQTCQLAVEKRSFQVQKRVDHSDVWSLLSVDPFSGISKF
jgi:hypothetical protein